MALPPQSAFLRPILEIADRSNGSLSTVEFLTELTPLFALSNDDLQERIPSGALRVDKHIRYSVYLLKQSGLLDTVPNERRGRYQITDQGRRYLQEQTGSANLAHIKMLAIERQQEDLAGFSRATLSTPINLETAIPDEQIGLIYEELQSKLADELLESLKAVSPDRFEQLVIDLLVKIGYGRGQHAGGSGDGGIDGIISQDRLGFEKVYIQAKRWSTAQIGEPEIRNFSGSLDPHGATKGVFITTSLFNDDARKTAANAQRNGKNIRLIDGQELARLMIEYDVGVVTRVTYQIKELDENYFAEA